MVWPMWVVYLRGSLRTRVLVEGEGKILLIQGWHGGGKWSLPGGGVHKGEQPARSAVREVAEETGIRLDAKQLTDLGQDIYKKNGLRFKMSYYGCRLQERPTTRKQHLEIAALNWVHIADITEAIVEPHAWHQLQAWKLHR